MNNEIQYLNESQRKINITMSQEETQKYFEEVLKEETKKLAIPGFRKGKAPLSLIKKMYGDSLFYNNLHKIALKKFWDEMDLQGIDVLGIPKISGLHLIEDGALKFEIQFEVYPNIKIDNLEEIEVEKVEYELSEKFREELIEYVRFEFRTEEPADKIDSMEYIVTLEKTNIIDEKSKTPEKIPVYLKNSSVNPEFVNLLMNKNLNDEFETSIPLVIKKEETNNQENQTPLTSRYKIVEIKKITLPEANDELAVKYSKGKISTLEELKKALVEAVLSYYKKQETDLLRNSIKYAMIKKFNFTPPSSLVKSYFYSRENNLKKKYKINELPKDVLSEVKRISEEDLKWDFIFYELQEKFGLFLTVEEIDEYAQKIAEENNLEKEKVLDYLHSDKSNLLDDLEANKFFDFLLSKIKVIPKKVTI
ncbi:MAG: trigger factor [Ignavibacteria bacterium]